MRHDEIVRRLGEIHDGGTKVLFAVESGSRAWGFASPDSDYDVRFVYKHDVDWYLGLSERRRETIEVSDGDLDMVGWDLRKYLRLMRKSNPSVMEWLQCPRYVVWSGLAMGRLERLAERCFSARSLAFHYAGMARENDHEFLRIKEPRLKKYLYVVRALLSADWVIRYDEMPPTMFPDLIDSTMCPFPRDAVEDVLARKLESGESEPYGHVNELDEWIPGKLANVMEMAECLPRRDPVPWEDIDEVFLSLLR